MLAQVFSRPETLKKALNATQVHGYLVDKDEKIDEVVLSVSREGHGYTKEEALEITCHGSTAVISRILSLLGKLGMRAAQGGEFTLRAFLAGSMDLTQAEAVQELVASQSQRERSLALGRLGGNLRNRIEQLKQQLLSVQASIEIQLDYAEDEIDDFSFPREKLNQIREGIQSLVLTYGMGRLYGQGAKVVLAGNTNAGKSSLFNLLLKQQRAIVSPIKGTTRDYLEAQTSLQGIPILLYDTAGLRENADEVESEGIRRTRQLLEEADVIIYLVDGTSETMPETALLSDVRCIRVFTKKDLMPKDGLCISCLTGDGIKDLLDELYQHLTAGLPEPDDAALVIESDRQLRQLTEAREAIDAALDAEKMSLDVVALELNRALAALGSLTGEVTSDDILHQIFSGFCVGK